MVSSQFIILLIHYIEIITFAFHFFLFLLTRKHYTEINYEEKY